ncbi:MAG: hypothetical protein R3325_12550 [Thermoanaerobaculia bacterium]|nr:hypothetical protein [Thermoanaerobaculia bacterium]
MNGGDELRRGALSSPLRSGLLLAVAGLAVLVALALLAPEQRGPRGDEPTYRAMVESVLADGDLRFDERDARRASDRSETLILQRAADGRIGYSKPALYPLAAAPLVALAGEAGYPLTNLLVLGVAVALGWALVRRGATRGQAALLLATFLVPSVALCYLTWRTADLVQLSLALAGMALALAGGRRAAGDPVRPLDGGLAVACGGLCLGLLTSLRFPNGLLAAATAAALALGGRRRRAAALLLAALVGLGGSLLLNAALTGAANPYKAVRASFNPQIGLPAGETEEAAEALAQFDEQRKTVRMTWAPVLEPSLSAYSSLYFLVGRHTGLLFYFPAALWLTLAALRRPDRATLALLGGAAALALFYLVWLPRNYFGGGTFVGNRYFLVAYPALLAAVRRPPSLRALAPAWGIAAVVAGSALVSVASAAPHERSSQLHAYAGLFRLLPLESTAEALDGPRERYWSDERLLFADPWAEVEPLGFHLFSERPPAELMLVSGRDHGVLRFIVQADVPAAELVISDWGSRRVVALAAPPGEHLARGLVEVEASPAWRRHPFPWSGGERWRAWVFRLGLDAVGGGPASAEVRFLGPYRPAPKFFAHQTVALELPETAAAGAETRLPVRVLNRGRRPWASRADVPVHLRYRLEPLAGGELVVGRVSRLPGVVSHRELLEGTLRVRWPRRPGRYRMTVDLVLGGTVWFESIGGAPLAEGVVEVREAEPRPARVVG